MNTTEDEVGSIYSQRIRQLRAKRKLSLRALAAKAGISVVHVHDIENGRKEPSVVKMIALAKALECPVSYLMGEDRPEPNQGVESAKLWDMHEERRFAAVEAAKWVTCSPHEWVWTHEQQVEMARYVLWATQRLNAIASLAKGDANGVIQ